MRNILPPPGLKSFITIYSQPKSCCFFAGFFILQTKRVCILICLVQISEWQFSQSGRVTECKNLNVEKYRMFGGAFLLILDVYKKIKYSKK